MPNTVCYGKKVGAVKGGCLGKWLLFREGVIGAAFFKKLPPSYIVLLGDFASPKPFVKNADKVAPVSSFGRGFAPCDKRTNPACLPKAGKPGLMGCPRGDPVGGGVRGGSAPSFLIELPDAS